MSYSAKQLMRMTFPLYDFGGSGSEKMAFKLPLNEQGKVTKGKLVNVGVMATEAFACDATNAKVQVGVAADPDKYAELNIPDLTADAGCVDAITDADAIIIEDIPAETLVEVTFTCGTDGTGVTGQGVPYIDMYVW